MKARTALITVLVTLILSGCGSIYKKDTACPGYTEDEKCQDLRETYEATHSFDREAYRRELRGQQTQKSSGHSSGSNHKKSPQPSQSVEYSPYMESQQHPRPILTQAVPVRVFIDPYEDDSGRLHTPGYVYVRATEPEWIFGQDETRDSRVVTPLITDD